MAKIGIDVDGVLANFVKAFCEQANKIWPGKVSKNWGQSNWDDLGGLTGAEINIVWERIKATSNWWMTLDAFTSNVGALAIFCWTQKAHDIYLVTSRIPTIGQTIAFQTDTWLRACGVVPCSNYIAVFPVPNSDDKAAIYKASGIEYSLDDKKETVEACDKLPDHKAFLLDRPYNQHAQVKRRVNSVQEYLDAIVKA